jgi:hypothetical protein
MKKRILFLSILFPVIIFAQDDSLKDIYKDVTTAINSALLTKAGVVEISGFASYNYYKTNFKDNESVTQNILQIEPVVSYFVADNIAIGLDVKYMYENSKISSNSSTNSNSQTFAGPVAKMYFGEERYRPFIMIDYLVLAGDSYDGGEVDLGGGLMYHLDGNIGLNLFAKYGIIWYDSDTLDNKNRIFLGIGLSGFIL